IHDDAEAAAATRAEHASAFAAGHDVFFDQRRFDPASSEGLHLLAHEVAHVLQQTARVGPDLRLHATVQPGSPSADVQRGPPTKPSGKQALDKIPKNHLDASSGASLPKPVADIRKACGGSLPMALPARPPAGDAIETIALDATRSKEARSFAL